VDEANAAGSAWRCPSCRDLCNCSFCRTRKGLPPTGTLYRRAVKEGFASVAHYLVLNNMADEENDGDGSKDGGGSEDVGDSKDGDDSPARVPDTPEKDTEPEKERFTILGVSPSKKERRIEDFYADEPLLQTPDKPKERKKRSGSVSARKRSRLAALECDVVAASAAASAARAVEDEPRYARTRGTQVCRMM
jgi:hypothetical protein